MDPAIIHPGDNPLTEEPTFTLTLTLTEAFAVKDAVACLWMETQGEAGSYANYADCGPMEAAHQVADRLHAMMQPHHRRFAAVLRAHFDAQERRN